jgi:hypothetical protein
MAAACELVAEDEKLATILSDFGGVADVGAYDFRKITNSDTVQTVIYNAIEADGNPRDKAKEWGARMLANQYRFNGQEIELNRENVGIFVIDGTWDQSDVTRLYRCGWDYVVRLGNLDEVLREVFGIEVLNVVTPTRLPALPEEDNDLPMAADDE